MNKRTQARSAARLAAVQALYQHEMEVVRRIERGAGSAYRLNGSDVRAKDVALIFADAATGAHSPALVSQNRIGAIIEDAEYADADVPFFDDIVRGVLARADEIDAAIVARLASGWTMERLDRTMKAILRAGYQKIGFLGTKMPLDYRARKRFEGFTEALAKGGVEVLEQEFYSGGSALAKGREMTQTILEREPELDFLYYSNDMIGAGGLLHLLDQGRKIPSEIGLAGFNGVELLQGLPRKLATMDACRTEIGTKAAEIIAARVDNPDASFEKIIELTPKIAYGDTLRH